MGHGVFVGTMKNGEWATRRMGQVQRKRATKKCADSSYVMNRQCLDHICVQNCSNCIRARSKPASSLMYFVLVVELDDVWRISNEFQLFEVSETHPCLGAYWDFSHCVGSPGCGPAACKDIREQCRVQ